MTTAVPTRTTAQGKSCPMTVPTREGNYGAGVPRLQWIRLPSTSICCRHRIWMLLIGATNEAGCTVFVPGGTVDERNGRQLLNHDLLDASECLLLYRWVR